MFQLDQGESYDWPVKVRVMEGGEHKIVTFTAKFKRFTQDELQKLLTAPYKDWREFLRKVVVGWGADVMNGGNPFPFSPENLDILMNSNAPHTVNALREAFSESTTAAAREKN